MSVKKFLFVLAFLFTNSLAFANEENHQKPLVIEKPDAIKYVQESILSPKASSCFQISYGDLQKADCILIVFTSMACPMCSDFHTQTLPKILDSKLFKSGKIAVVDRDYPADPLSLQASAAVWANKKTCKEKRNALFEKTHKGQDGWTQNIAAMKEVVLNLCTSLDEKENVEKTLSDEAKTLMKDIFKQRNLDKPVLQIDEVPCAFLFFKQNGQKEKLMMLSSVTDLEDIENIFSYQEKK